MLRRHHEIRPVEYDPHTFAPYEEHRLLRIVLAAGLAISIVTAVEAVRDIMQYDPQHPPEVTVTNPTTWVAVPIVDAIESARTGN